MTRITRTRLDTSLRLAVAAALLGPAVGCQTMGPGKDRASNSRKADATATAGTDTQKTEFHREVGPEQEYNVHVELARALESQGNHETAITEYQKAVAVCERKGSILTHSKLGPAQRALAERRTGAAYDRLGRFAQAETHYLKALKLAPGDAKVWNDAGYSYYVQNRLADAERCLKTADSLDPNNQRVQTNLGLTFAAQGRNDEALAALCRAGGPAIGHANLGYILAAMGKTDLAREHYRSAIDLQPQLAAARQALAKLDSMTPASATAIASAAKPIMPSLPAVVPAVGAKDPGLARASAPVPSSKPKTVAAPSPVVNLPPVNPATVVPTPVK